MENDSFEKMERDESKNFFDIVKLTKERANEKKNEEFSTKISRKVRFFLNKNPHRGPKIQKNSFFLMVNFYGFSIINVR